MARTRPAYPEEFRREAVELVRSGRSIRDDSRAHPRPVPAATTLSAAIARSPYIHPTDTPLRGPVESGQYTALAFGQRCRQAGIEQSNSRPGSPHDNAVKESFFATLAKERLRGRRYATHAQARSCIFEYIEGFYNSRRLHSTLGYRSPTKPKQTTTSARAPAHEHPPTTTTVHDAPTTTPATP